MGNISIRDISNTLIHWKCNNNFRKQLKKLLQIKRDQIYISYLLSIITIVLIINLIYVRDTIAPLIFATYNVWHRLNDRT